MKRFPRAAGKQRAGDSGYVLLLILFLLALVAIAMIAVAPSIARQIQRQRELELIRRGQQYARAIRLFYRKAGRYPNSIKELLQTNDIRFLRKPFKDPMTRSGEWRLIHVGESTYNPAGFFGQTLLPQSNNSGAAPAGASLFAPPDQNHSPANGAGNSPGGQGANAGAESSAGDSGSKSLFGDANAEAIGGGPIVGVASTDKDQSLIVYNGKDHYNQWEFVYDPRMEQRMAFTVGPAAPPNGAKPPGANPPSPVPNPGGLMNPNPQ